MDFSNSDFTGASLAGATLLGTNLSNSDLHGANLRTELSGANLDGANLEGASSLSWFAGRTKGIASKEDAPPASLRGTKFGGTTVVITALVGLIGHTASVDLDAPDFDNATLDCWERPLDSYLTPALRNDSIAAAQARLEADALRFIMKKWPTAKLTERCSALQGLATSATP